MPRVLDLFCCCGGAAKGLHDAGFEVVGVDITNNHEYPYEFVCQDVFTLGPRFFEHFDLIWASPPCQHYSYGMQKFDQYKQYPDLVGPTRELLLKTGKPFIIENVVGAPLRKDIQLCGEMFGLRVVRHRIFEINGFVVPQPKHIKHREKVGRKSWYMCVAGHGGQSVSTKFDDWKKAMNIYHIIDKVHLKQAVPPAYSEYIGRYFTLVQK